MAAPTPGTPAYYKLPQATRIAQWRAAERGTGNMAASLEYLTPDEYKFIQAAGIPAAQWASEIKTKFPDQAPYLAIPEIANILHLAVASKWSAEVLDSNLKASTWYLSRTPAQRQWFLSNATDPTGAMQSVTQQTQIIMREAQSLGVAMSAGQAMQLATNTLQFGWDGPTITDNIMKGNVQNYTHGTLGATKDSLRGQAEQYLIPMSDAGLDAWTRNISSGRADPKAYQDYLAQQAKSRFKDPELHKALDQGMTVSEFADPYVQSASQLLGLNPHDINLADGKWMTAIDHADPKTGQKRAMTLDEWQTNLRTDPRYGYDHSANGISQASQLVTGLKQQWGMT